MTELLTVKTAAKLRGVHYKTVYGWIMNAAHPLETTRPGNEYLIDPAVLAAYTPRPAHRPKRIAETGV